VRRAGRQRGLLRIGGKSSRSESLVEWARRVDRQKGRHVESIGHFSALPRLVDVAPLTIDENDLEDTQDCRPGDCKVKLNAREIAAMARGGPC
jgi:hypothetical protein